MLKKRFWQIGFQTLLFSFLLFSSHARADQKLRFGVYVWQRPRLVVEAMRPLLDQIQTDLSRVFNDNVQIQIFLYKDKHKLRQDIISGKLDIARLDPSQVLTAYLQNPALQLAAIETQTHTKTIPFIIATSSQSSLKDLSALEGHSFVFGERGSVLGDRLPEWILLQNLVLTDHLSEIQYVADESKRAEMIEKAQIDAGVVSREFFEKKQNLKKLFEYEGLLEGWVVRGGFNSQTLRALTEELVYTLRRHESLQKIDRAGFVKGDFADYEEISQAGELGEALSSEGLGKKNIRIERKNAEK